MPPARKPRLRHVPVRLRVSIDPQRWRDTYGRGDEKGAALDEDVRRYVLDAIQQGTAAREGAIASVRRDGL